MASDQNTINIIGRLTNDPELKATQSGTQVSSFSIAVNKTWSQNGEKKEQVSFFNCTAWGKLGELIVQYCKKGQQLAITGALEQQSWEDKDGNKRSAVKIICSNVQFLGKAQGASDQPVNDDNIPF